MRDLDTDRPDQTETPITVDAGHFQVEADLVSYTWTDEGGIRSEALSAPVLNLKAGLVDHADLQLVVSPYTYVRTTDRSTAPASVKKFSGFGDTQARLKINLWGNDGEPTALAVMPFIQFPTGEEGITSDSTEGGVIIPFSFDLPAGFVVGTMWETDFLRDSSGVGYHADFIQSLAVGRDLVGPLSGYVEFFTVVSTEAESDWIGQFDFGINYLVHRDLKFDAGVNIGVTSSAPDWNPFVGVTWRY